MGVARGKSGKMDGGTRLLWTFHWMRSVQEGTRFFSDVS